VQAIIGKRQMSGSTISDVCIEQQIAEIVFILIRGVNCNQKRIGINLKLDPMRYILSLRGIQEKKRCNSYQNINP
jgi:hypothetical protein